MAVKSVLLLLLQRANYHVLPSSVPFLDPTREMEFIDGTFAKSHMSVVLSMRI